MLGIVVLRTGLVWMSGDSAAGQSSSQTYFDQLGEKKEGKERERERFN